MTLRPADPAVEVWQHLLLFERAVALSLDADLQRERALTLEEYDVLFQLSSRGEPVRMSELASLVLIARSSCTRLVDRLVGRGWVERRQNAEDRRSVTVELTVDGRAALRRAAVTHLRGVDSLFASRLDSKDLTDLQRVLNRLYPMDEQA